jgi:hypothetical protein
MVFVSDLSYIIIYRRDLLFIYYLLIVEIIGFLNIYLHLFRVDKNLTEPIASNKFPQRCQCFNKFDGNINTAVIANKAI